MIEIRREDSGGAVILDTVIGKALWLTPLELHDLHKQLGEMFDKKCGHEIQALCPKICNRFYGKGVADFAMENQSGNDYLPKDSCPCGRGIVVHLYEAMRGIPCQARVKQKQKIEKLPVNSGLSKDSWTIWEKLNEVIDRLNTL